MMTQTFFKVGQHFILPDLSGKLGLTAPDFVIAQIFEGGMGTCAKIKNANGQNFALKIIHNSLLQDGPALLRYIDEMKTWLTLSACNGVVEAICVTKINGIPCIASQWMDYGSLTPFLRQKNPELFYENIDRIATTLDWAFEKYSIIHRDLKPENILLDNIGKAYIADWGLSRPISRQTEETNFQNALNKFSNRIDITDAGSFLGTILYASPEQILGLKGIDHRSDIYSLGCIMYEWETGAPPFIANTPQEIALQHLRKKPKSLVGLFRSTNYKVEKIIEKCLEKEPNRRYQSYSDLIDDFHSIARKHSTFKKFIVVERYKVPLIGENEFKEKIEGKKLNAAFSHEGKYAIIEQSEVDPYLKEAENLIALGEYGKAKKILEVFYVHDFFKKIPDSHFVQYICINLAFAMRYTGEIDSGILVLRTIDDANSKPVNYFLNLSLLYLSKNEFQNAESICRQGIKLFPTDSELLGNLTIALTNQDKLVEAYETSSKRISLSRNANSLIEFAGVFYRLAENQKNIDFPKAISYYKKSLTYVEEAKQLNPNFDTARLLISNLLFKLRRYEESINEAAEVGKGKNVVNEIQLFYHARNVLWLGGFKECIDFCDKWILTFPNSAFLKRVRAEALVDGFVINHYKDGTPVIEESSLKFFTDIIKDPKKRLPSDFKFLAKIYAWMGDAENINYALSWLNEGINLFPDYWQFDFTLSVIWQRHKYFDEALKAAMEAKRKAPWRENIFFLISSIYKAKGDTINAKKYEEEGVKLKEEKIKLYT